MCPVCVRPFRLLLGADLTRPPTAVPTKEMNCLEVEFLAIINFDLFVDPQVYALFYRELCNAKLHTQCDCDTEGKPSLRLRSRLRLCVFV